MRCGLLPVILLGVLGAPVAAAERIDFARDIRPLLERHCIRCHGPKKQEAGLRLDLRRAALAGGDAGPAIVPRSPGKSDLIRRVESTNDEKRMPPTGRALEKSQIAVLRTWIEQGADWPDVLAGSDSTSGHWAFAPIRRTVPPLAPGVCGSIDSFILARLGARGLAFSPPADARTLVRRVHLDLIGLPPEPAEVGAFLADARPDAWERLVDRLLASPHFGERWGRHWLDLARFAESDGYENDRHRPHAWIWRDWVIGAYNGDLPFDQFTTDQLAGDLVPSATMTQKIATGLHRNTLYNSAASGDKEEFRTRAVKDQVETTGQAWLGLTLGCAQCHSHKYDPVTQREYYRFYAFFNNAGDQSLPVPGGKAMVLHAVKRVSHVHRRGNFLDKGNEVKPSTPAFLPPLQPRGAGADRLDLARWLVRSDNPLTPRVAVNHAWQHLFGQGLIRTPENFGKEGDRPHHPELLDWLASEFQADWSRKRLIRRIVLSTAYRQSSRRTPGLDRVDPDNHFLARQNRYRLEAEVIRDSALSVAGLLDRKLGGPSIVPPYPKELPEGQFKNEEFRRPTRDRHRRGLYIHIQRTLLHPSLATLDGADGNQPCPKRDRGCTPVQALTLLNDPVFAECARVLGGRLRREAGDPDARLDLGFRLCLARPSQPEEKEVLAELIARQRALKVEEPAAWAGFARVLLNLDEFITRE
jgi:mono/diheme cytochrome c family protein